VPHDPHHPETPEADEAGPAIDEEIAAHGHEDHGVTAHERETLVPDLLARRFASDSRSYWQIVWGDFRKNTPAVLAMWVMLVMALVAIFAPLIANHRPFLLTIPQSVDIPPNAAVSHGVQWPLFAALGAVDWVLLFGFAQVVIAFFMFRRARARQGRAGRFGVTLLVVAALLPLPFALIALSGRPVSEVAPGQPGDPMKLWFALTGDYDHIKSAWSIVYRIAFDLIGLIGIALLIRAAIDLYRGRRDVLGNLTTGSSTVMMLAGSLMILLLASQMGTIGQRDVDTTDYARLASTEGVTAIFAPVQQNYLKSNPYIKNQRPLGPHTRIIPSGESNAAIDLGLTDTRRRVRLSLENSERASAETPVPISRATPLSHLRRGEGVRIADDGSIDFTITAESLERFSVSIAGTETVGDALDRISEATGGVIKASIGPDGSRINISDQSAPAARNLFGTDAAGSDVASRLIHATRVALSIGFVSTTIALLIGITMGALMGYFGGWVDIVGMRIIEIFMAIPRLFLLLTVIAFIPPEWNEYMLYAMMAVIGAFSWMGAARFIRAEFLRLRDQDFVQAAKAVGLPLRSVLFRHMLPNGVTPVLVDASFGVAAAIFVETGLSFLGFGIKPPNPSWGKMLAEAVDTSTGVFNWWLAIFPGIMIFLTVFAFNLIGDALRDAIDPKLKKAAA